MKYTLFDVMAHQLTFKLYHNGKMRAIIIERENLTLETGSECLYQQAK